MLATVTKRLERCEHLATIVRAARRPQPFCEECLAEDGAWLSLRVCLSCGHVGCGDDSQGDHALQHYAETDHPIAAAFGPGPSSLWCYPDRRPV